MNDDFKRMKDEIIRLEEIIATQRNYVVMEEVMESDLASGELDPETRIEQSELSILEKMESQGEVPESAQKIIKEKRGLLDEAFSFYSFGIDLNDDQKQFVFKNNYNRLLEKELID